MVVNVSQNHWRKWTGYREGIPLDVYRVTGITSQRGGYYIHVPVHNMSTKYSEYCKYILECATKYISDLSIKSLKNVWPSSAVKIRTMDVHIVKKDTQKVASLYFSNIEMRENLCWHIDLLPLCLGCWRPTLVCGVGRRLAVRKVCVRISARHPTGGLYCRKQWGLHEWISASWYRC